MSEPNKVARTSRRVIESKLLEALEDGGAVAVVLTKEDLDELIQVFRAAKWRMEDQGSKPLDFALVDYERRSNLLAGFEQLRKEAFP